MVTGLEAFDIRSDSLDNSSEIDAKWLGPSTQKQAEDAWASPDHVPIEHVHSRSAHGNKNVAVARHRLVDILEFEDVGGTELTIDDRLHRSQTSCTRSSGLGQNCTAALRARMRPA